MSDVIVAVKMVWKWHWSGSRLQSRPCPSVVFSRCQLLSNEHPGCSGPAICEERPGDVLPELLDALGRCSVVVWELLHSLVEQDTISCCIILKYCLSFFTLSKARYCTLQLQMKVISKVRYSTVFFFYSLLFRDASTSWSYRV